MINVRNTRRLAALTALVLVLLAGCGQSGASPDTPPGGHAPEETETAQTASPSDETAAQTESPSQNEADTAVNRGGTPVDALPEDLPEEVPEGQLGCWMLYNQDMDQAFFSYQ